MLTKAKTQPPPHTTHNVIYQIPCKDCNATYCGQTRRPLHLRLSEHQRFTNNSKSFTSTDLQYTSAVAHHAHTTGHTIDFKSTHILSSLTKSSQLDLIEHAAIKITCPSLNKLHSAPNINNNGQTSYRQLRTHLDRDSHIHLNFALIFCFMLMIVLFTYFWSSDPLSHPYSQALTLTPYSHVLFSSSYF